MGRKWCASCQCEVYIYEGLPVCALTDDCTYSDCAVERRADVAGCPRDRWTSGSRRRASAPAISGACR